MGEITGRSPYTQGIMLLNARGKLCASRLLHHWGSANSRKTQQGNDKDLG